jgi:hypothetical protein
MLQGVFLFLVFIAKPSIWEATKKKYPRFAHFFGFVKDEQTTGEILELTVIQRVSSSIRMNSQLSLQISPQ